MTAELSMGDRLSSSETTSSDGISQTGDDSEEWADCQTSIGQNATSEKRLVTPDSDFRAPSQQQASTGRKVTTTTKTPSLSRESSEDGQGKPFTGGVLFGAGFPSGPPPSGNVIVLPKGEEGQILRFREASDSEWDAVMENQKKKVPPSRYMQRRETSNNNPRNDEVEQPPPRSARTAYDRRRGYGAPGQQEGYGVPANELGYGAAGKQGYENQNEQRRRDLESRTRPAESSAEKPRREDATQQSSQNLVYKNYLNNIPRNRRMVSKMDFVKVCRQLLGPDSDDEQNCDEADLEVQACFQANNSTKSESEEECYLPLRPSCVSSVLIDNFVIADLDAGMVCSEVRRRGDTKHVDDLLHNLVHKFFSSTNLSSGALSVIVDLFEFPPTLSSRPTNRLLRPVIIDGCAVSGCFDKEYSVYWGRIKDIKKLAWAPCKVLSIKPIYQCLVEFLLRGHKVTVLLPAYYRDASFNDLRSKVDDVEALNVLLNLKLIQFIDNSEGRHIIDEIRAQVDKVDALLVSSGYYDSRDEWQFSASSTFKSAGATSTLPTAFTQASKRMLTPIFFGRNQDMTIVYTFSTKESGTWKSIPEKVLCYYEPGMDSDRNIDDAGRLCQQLLFEDQIRLLVAVKDLFEWSCLHRRGISALLRLNFLAMSKLCS